MPDDKKLDRDLAILNAVYHEAGLEAAENASKESPSRAREAKLDAMLARARATLRKARTRALGDAQEESVEPPRPIPERILAMPRDAVLTRLRELMSEAGSLQPAMQFRDLDDLTTPDLQRLLADLEELREERHGA